MHKNISDVFLAECPTTFGRPELENTGKILLPESFLDRIMRSGQNQQIMLFTIKNTHSQQEVAAGVESFTSDNATVIIPKWMMKFIDITDNDRVNVSLQRFPTGTFVTFQPFKNSFFELPDFRVILEYCLRGFPCFTQGSVIPIFFHNQVYDLKVLKTEPQKMISCFHSDIQTDFAAALDTFDHHWGEEEDEYVPQSIKDKQNAPNPAFQGPSHSLK